MARLLEPESFTQVRGESKHGSNLTRILLTSIIRKGEVVFPLSSGSCTLTKLCKFGVAVTFENNANKCMQTMSHISNYRRHVDPADKDSCAPGQAPTRSDQHEMQDNQQASDVIGEWVENCASGANSLVTKVILRLSFSLTFAFLSRPNPSDAKSHPEFFVSVDQSKCTRANANHTNN